MFIIILLHFMKGIILYPYKFRSEVFREVQNYVEKVKISGGHEAF
jgi:hypothetical protein